MSRGVKQDQSEIPVLLRELKSLLKARGFLYHDVAERMGVSEPTVKRYLTGHGLTVEILEDLCHVVDVRLSDLLAMSQGEPERPSLSPEEEQFLVRDAFQAAVFYLLSHGFSPAAIQRDFQLTDAELNGYLTALDRLGLIRLFPYNRVRVLVGRNFNVQKDGAMAQLAHDAMLKDFFREFDMATPDWQFSFGKLSPSSLERVRELTRNFVDAFDTIAEADAELTLDLADWYGFFCMFQPVNLAGLRTWSPDAGGQLSAG
jgi:transcriptional regulator with XRE-family HTH domain